MYRPDHRTLVQRLQKEVDECLSEHNGRPPGKRLYRLRDTLKRWYKENADYRLQLEEIEAHGVSADGHSDPSYARARINEIAEKIEILSTLDLRTAEEVRGHNRKDYTYGPTTAAKIEDGLGSLTNEHYIKIKKRLDHQQRRSEKQQEKLEKLRLTPGHPERRSWYLHLRSMINGNPRTLEIVQAAGAAKAICEKHGGTYEYSEEQQKALDEYVEVLAKLEDLDREYSDVADTDLFNPLKGVFADSGIITTTNKDHSITVDYGDEFDPSDN